MFCKKKKKCDAISEAQGEDSYPSLNMHGGFKNCGMGLLRNGKIDDLFIVN
jgi:hypothetical protein